MFSLRWNQFNYLFSGHDRVNLFHILNDKIIFTKTLFQNLLFKISSSECLFFKKHLIIIPKPKSALFTLFYSTFNYSFINTHRNKNTMHGAIVTVFIYKKVYASCNLFPHCCWKTCIIILPTVRVSLSNAFARWTNNKLVSPYWMILFVNVRFIREKVTNCVSLVLKAVILKCFIKSCSKRFM